MHFVFYFSESINTSPKKFVRTDEGTQDEIKRMTSMISSNDWRERHQGIKMLLSFCESNAQIVAANATKVSRGSLRSEHSSSWEYVLGYVRKTNRVHMKTYILLFVKLQNLHSHVSYD